MSHRNETLTTGMNLRDENRAVAVDFEGRSYPAVGAIAIAIAMILDPSEGKCHIPQQSQAS